jgi:hypothetical protein
MIAAELNHVEVRRQFAAFLADDLPDAEHPPIATHLSHCPACTTALVALLQSLRYTVDLLHTLPIHQAPPILRQRLLAIPDQEAI